MTVEILPVDICAIHEAGHAVVADRLGILADGPAAVSIEGRTEDGDTIRVFGGLTEWSPDPWPRDVTEDTFDPSWLPIVEKRLSVLHAGQLAEEIFYGGADPRNSGRDTELTCRLVELLSYAVPEWEAQDACRTAAHEQAKIVLDTNRPAIIAVAGELILHRRLAGCLVHGIISGARVSVDGLPDLA